MKTCHCVDPDPATCIGLRHDASRTMIAALGVLCQCPCHYGQNGAHVLHSIWAKRTGKTAPKPVEREGN
jgi:hypothetical protein